MLMLNKKNFIVIVIVINTRNKHNLKPKQSNRVYMYKKFSFIGVHI